MNNPIDMKYVWTLPLLLALIACNGNKNKFDASGTFEATEVIVSAEANGKIMTFNLHEGDKLKFGDEIGYIDTMQLYLRKGQLTAGLRSVDIRKPDIQKQIAALEQQIATLRTEQTRMENLVRANAGNQKQVDDIVHQIANLERQREAQYSTLSKTSGSANAEAESIQFQIMQLDDQLLKSRIINPQTGTVLTKYAEAGEVVAMGKPLYKIADTELLYLRAYITADQLSEIRLGETVRVFADYGDEMKEYGGTINWISDKAEFTPKGIQTKDERANLVYAVKVAVKNDGFLKIGQYGELVFNK